jgi:hypothetical protein
MNDIVITKLIALREAQKVDEEKRTSSTLAERVRCELWIDNFLADHMRTLTQLDMWKAGRAKKTDEVAGVYNVAHAKEGNAGA